MNPSQKNHVPHSAPFHAYVAPHHASVKVCHFSDTKVNKNSINYGCIAPKICPLTYGTSPKAPIITNHIVSAETDLSYCSFAALISERICRHRFLPVPSGHSRIITHASPVTKGGGKGAIKAIDKVPLRRPTTDPLKRTGTNTAHHSSQPKYQRTAAISEITTIAHDGASASSVYAEGHGMSLANTFAQISSNTLTRLSNSASSCRKSVIGMQRADCPSTAKPAATSSMFPIFSSFAVAAPTAPGRTLNARDYGRGVITRGKNGFTSGIGQNNE